MPVIAWWAIIAVAGAVGLRSADEALDSASNLVKWAAVAGAVYAGGKIMKTW